MSEFSSCPDPEVLAAFIDGRLSGDRRRAVVAHLDACEDCYVVFSEAVRFQGEDEPRGRVVTSDRFVPRRWIWPAVAAAAVLVVLVAVPVLRMNPRRPAVATSPGGSGGTAATAELVAAIGHPATGGASETAPWPGWPGWPDEGSLGFAGSRLPPETASFRVGVRLVDLRVAIQSADGATARTAAAGLARTVAASGAEPELTSAAAEVSHAAAGERFEDLGEATERLETESRATLQPRVLAFGAWAEASRLAAARGDASFFASKAFAAGLDDGAIEALGPEDAQVLSEIRRLTRTAPSRADLEALERTMKTLLAHYDGPE